MNRFVLAGFITVLVGAVIFIAGMANDVSPVAIIGSVQIFIGLMMMLLSRVAQ